MDGIKLVQWVYQQRQSISEISRSNEQRVARADHRHALRCLHKLEVRNRALQYLNLRVDLLRDGLEHHHVGDQCCEFPVELHVVVANDVEHADQEVDAFDFEDAGVVEYAEEFFELVLVVYELALYDFVAFEVGEFEDHVGASFAVALDDGLDEVHKVGSILLVQLDHHTHVDHVYLHLLRASPQQIPYPLLLLPTRRVQLLQSGALQEVQAELFLKLLELFADVLLDLAEEAEGLLADFHQDVATVAVSVNKVILHEHLEESGSAQPSDHCVQWMSILLEVGHGHSLNEGLDEDRIPGHLLESLRETDLLVADKVLVENVQVVLLDVEVDLVDESLLQRVLAYWNFVSFGKQREELADPEEDVDVSLDVLVDFRVTHLHSHLPALVHSLIDLTN